MTQTPDWRTLGADALAALLAEHDRHYHDRGQAIISDAEYDAMRDHLRALAPDHPQLQRVGAVPVASGRDQVVHAVPMLSLDKCTDVASFWSWLEYNWLDIVHETRVAISGADDTRERKVLEREAQKLRLHQWAADAPEAQLVMTPKLDGLACSLRYDAAGKLTVAATRGDGRVGEVVLRAAQRLPDVPQQLASQFAGAEVRGEVYLPLSAFAAVADQFANPRNLAAGILKAKEDGVLGPEALRFAAYDLLGVAWDSEVHKFETLAAMGFAPAQHWPLAAAAAADAFARALVDKDRWDFEADGVVFRHNALAVQRLLPSTGHHPRAAVAWKFPVQSAKSVLREIEWSVSRTGVITPVAIVEPVILSGATVTRATLHNLDRFFELAPHSGDVLEMIRRGGVIPHVEANLGGGETAMVPPAHCPACGSPTQVDQPVRSRRLKRDGQTVLIDVPLAQVLRCSTPESCTQSRTGRIVHFAASLSLEGLGDKIAADLVDAGLVSRPLDLFKLSQSDLMSLPSVGQVVADKLLAQLQRVRTCTLREFLLAIGVKGIGSQTAGQIAARYTLAELLEVAGRDAAAHAERVAAGEPVTAATPKLLLMEVPSLGWDSAAAIALVLTQRQAELTELAAEFAFAPQAELVGEGPLSGQVLVFTGKLEMALRSAAQKRAVALGATAGDGVTEATTILVVGGDEMDSPTPSSKLKKAQKLAAGGHPIQILSETAYYERFPEAAP